MFSLVIIGCLTFSVRNCWIKWYWYLCMAPISSFFFRSWVFDCFEQMIVVSMHNHHFEHQRFRNWAFESFETTWYLCLCMTHSLKNDCRDLVLEHSKMILVFMHDSHFKNHLFWSWFFNIEKTWHCYLCVAHRLRINVSCT